MPQVVESSSSQMYLVSPTLKVLGGLTNIAIDPAMLGNNQQELMRWDGCLRPHDSILLPQPDADCQGPLTKGLE